jgi:serine phosphatase RsbU (regulator of sigma subunit)
MVDGTLTVGVAVAISISISGARESVARPPDAIAYGLGLLMAALLIFRRRWPLGVLFGTAIIFTIYAQLNYPGFFPAVPLAVPLYTVAATRGIAWPTAISAWWVLSTLLYQLFETDRPVTQVINSSLRDGAFFMVIVLLGAVVRSRRDHAAEVAERIRRAEAESERVAEELRVARLVQEQFLPAELPDIPGWQVAAFYRSAREVGGDFYSFIELPSGKVGVAIGDVTDKGAPAALVMATTQGLLRSEAARTESPSAVLKSINEVLVHNTPERMFVTCLYLVLDPSTGHVQFANAGHNLPYVWSEKGVHELKATGLPLGIMPAATYEESNALMPADSRLLLHSDGIAEAHNGERDMFGFPRIIEVMEARARDGDLINKLLAELDSFTGPQWEQEDDITLVTLDRGASLLRSETGT